LSLIFVVSGQLGLGTIKDYSATYTATSLDTVPPDSSTGSCVCSFSYNSSDSTISGTLTCTGLSSGTSFTSAHIHDFSGSETCGNTGGVLYTLGPTFTKAAIDTTVGYVEDLCYGYTYINVHTTAFPAGEVRINLVDLYANCKTGTSLTDRSTTAPTTFPYTPVPSDGETPGFSNVFTCGTTPSCALSVAYEYDDWLYVGGSCTGLTGNISSVIATSQDSDASTFTLYSYSSSYDPCPSNNHFSTRYSMYLSDAKTLCEPVSGNPWGLVIKTTTTSEQVTCSIPKNFCPPVYGSVTPPPPGTSSANVFSVAILFTLFFSLISLWLN